MYRVRVGSLLSASIFRSFSRSQMHHLLVFLFRRIFKPAEILVYLFFARSSSFKRIYRFQSFSDLVFSFMREAQASDSFCDGHGLGSSRVFEVQDPPNLHPFYANTGTLEGGINSRKSALVSILHPLCRLHDCHI